jgi:hypothetical protein
MDTWLTSRKSLVAVVAAPNISAMIFRLFYLNFVWHTPDPGKRRHSGENDKKLSFSPHPLCQNKLECLPVARFLA